MGNEEAEYEALKDHIKQRGFDCSYYRDNYVKRRINLRLLKRKSAGYRAYQALLKSDPKEYQELVDCLAINVTSFFRDVTPYKAMREKVFPALAERALREGRREVRVWSSACSTGEEPYSLAISAHEALSAKIQTGLKVSIIASDIDENALRAASKGEYSPQSVKDMDESILKRYFSEKDGKYTVRDVIREMVSFRKLDLIQDLPVVGMDVVFCRNMLIYIPMGHQDVIFDKFSRALNPGGYLVIGKSEMLPPAYYGVFKSAYPDERIYQKAADSPKG